MKNNLKIVQINGFRGLLFSFFIMSCFFAGFIIFPAFLTMGAWNFLAVKTSSFPQITIYEGLLLWAIIVLSIFLFGKRKLIVSFDAAQELTEDEVKHVITRIKSQTVNPKIISPEEISFTTEKKEELDLQPESKDK